MAKRSEIYLRFRADALPADAELQALLREARPAAALMTGAAEDIRGDAASAFLQAARRQSLAVLIENDAPLAQELGLEGVHLRADEAAVAEARRQLGADRSVGASCELSRHDAMNMAERGADYIAFGEWGTRTGPNSEALVEMISWWSDLIELPCVAWIWDEDADDHIAALARAGADFLAVGAGVGEIEARLERVRRVVRLANGQTEAE
jgi:thiamine-phosphate pyrophosphorylase